MGSYCGVDGCGAGWFAVALSEEGRWESGLFPSVRDLWKRHSVCASILIDIPIGLTEDGTTRACDREARRLLGCGRASSVFTPPCRQALRAGSYGEACVVNRNITGKALSKQAWNIFPRMREMDEFLKSHRRAGRVFREAHPEIAFLSLEGHAMRHGKTNHAGFGERRAVLQRVFPETYAVVAKSLDLYRRRDVRKDDILDALALAVTALLAGGRLSPIPDPPEVDRRGLEMAIWRLVPPERCD
jgi:predicted RNase H-like nuclease